MANLSIAGIVGLTMDHDNQREFREMEESNHG